MLIGGVLGGVRGSRVGHGHDRTAATQGPCREYTLDAQVGGKTERMYGTACRQPDGSWHATP